MKIRLGTPGRLADDPHCPACGGGADAFTPWGEDAKAGPGDIGVCLYCLAPLIYDGEPLRPRMPTPAERAELAQHQGLQRALLLMRRLPRPLRRRFH